MQKMWKSTTYFEEFGKGKEHHLQGGRTAFEDGQKGDIFLEGRIIEISEHY